MTDRRRQKERDPPVFIEVNVYLSLTPTPILSGERPTTRLLSVNSQSQRTTIFGNQSTRRRHTRFPGLPSFPPRARNFKLFACRATSPSVISHPPTGKLLAAVAGAPHRGPPRTSGKPADFTFPPTPRWATTTARVRQKNRHEKTKGRRPGTRPARSTSYVTINTAF